jgi:hypothetical protein
MVFQEARGLLRGFSKLASNLKEESKNFDLDFTSKSLQKFFLTSVHIQKVLIRFLRP